MAKTEEKAKAPEKATRRRKTSAASEKTKTSYAEGLLTEEDLLADANAIQRVVLEVEDSDSEASLISLLMEKSVSGAKSTPQSRSNYIDVLMQSPDFKQIIAKRGNDNPDISGNEFEKLNHGGYSTVYSIDEDKVVKLTSLRHSYLLSNVAKKSFLFPIIKSKGEVIKEQYKRFCREAEILCRTDKADAFVVEIRESEDKVYDIILALFMKKYQPVNWNQTMSEEEAKEVVLQVLNQLSHNGYYIHRDIKPENILFDKKEKEYVLMDWDGAKDLRSGTYTERRTIEEEAELGDYPHPAVIMSPYYTHPLRYNSSMDKESDRDIDIYSLGVLMARMIYPGSEEAFRHEMFTQRGEDVYAFDQEAFDKQPCSDAYKAVVIKATSYCEPGESAPKATYSTIDEMMDDVRCIGAAKSSSAGKAKFYGLKPYVAALLGGGAYLFALLLAFIGDFMYKTSVPKELICAAASVGLFGWIAAYGKEKNKAVKKSDLIMVAVLWLISSICSFIAAAINLYALPTGLTLVQLVIITLIYYGISRIPFKEPRSFFSVEFTDMALWALRCLPIGICVGLTYMLVPVIANPDTGAVFDWSNVAVVLIFGALGSFIGAVCRCAVSMIRISRYSE